VDGRVWLFLSNAVTLAARDLDVSTIRSGELVADERTSSQCRLALIRWEPFEMAGFPAKADNVSTPSLTLRARVVQRVSALTAVHRRIPREESRRGEM
jgi:hypothetical protein